MFFPRGGKRYHRLAQTAELHRLRLESAREPHCDPTVPPRIAISRRGLLSTSRLADCRPRCHSLESERRAEAFPNVPTANLRCEVHPDSYTRRNHWLPLWQPGNKVSCRLA